VTVAAAAAGVSVHQVSDDVIEALSDAVTPQGVVAIAPMHLSTLDDLTANDLVLVLDEVRDPGNAGTLVRSAVAAGAGGIVFGHGSVDPFGPKTVRSSSGTILRTKIVRDAPLVDALARLRDAGFSVIGSDAAADGAADEVDLSGRVALVVGNEARGLTAPVRDAVDLVVRIPLPGPVESLNAAVAGSILLFECVRQRKAVR
jgi:TrmH family RNA methyltransferase